MAVVTLNSTSLLFVATNETTYAAAREGSGVSKYISQFGWVGQYFGGSYEVNQVFVGFDLAGLPTNAVITAAKLTLTIAESFGTTVVEVRQHDFQNNNINAFVAGSQLASKQQLGSTVVNNGFIGTAAIDLTGLTRDGLAKFVLASTSQRTGTAPTGDTTTRVTAATLEVTYSLVTVITATGSGSWAVPTGITSAKIECWSGGQGGGDYVGGGRGGNYASNLAYSVTAGATINFSVGAGGGSGQYSNTPGGDTWFGGAGLLLAKGGGATSGSIGPITSYGGAGDATWPNQTGGGSGGGGAAGPHGAGGNASAYPNPQPPVGGASGSTTVSGTSHPDGGSGGGLASSGGSPGGGGGSKGPFGGGASGAGGRGQIRITYDTAGSTAPPTPARRPQRSFHWL